MSMADVAIWGQLISSAAVLITLGYLAIRTRQTASLLRSESQQPTFDGDLQILTTVVESPKIWLDWISEDELPPEGKIRLEPIFYALCVRGNSNGFNIKMACWTILPGGLMEAQYLLS